MILGTISKGGIYAVRGFAAMLVLVLHITSILTPQSLWIEKTGMLSRICPWIFRGEVGVGVFIFLSGFLLALNIPKSPKEWSRFYLRRFSRIYPVYIVLLILSISASKYWDLHGFINALFLLPNFPGTLWPAPWLSTAWSLGIEWSLYFFFPIIIFSLRERARNLILLLAFFQIMILYSHLFGTDFHTLVYGSVLGRAIEFILGVYFASQLERIRRLNKNKFIILLFISYSIFHVWCAWYLSDGGSVSESYLRLIQPIAESLFGFFLILISQIPIGRYLLKFRMVLTSVGILSYPLYLTHLIILDGVSRISIRHQDSILVTSVALKSILVVVGSLILAWIIHEAIEKPAMRLGRTSTS